MRNGHIKAYRDAIPVNYSPGQVVSFLVSMRAPPYVSFLNCPDAVY